MSNKILIIDDDEYTTDIYQEVLQGEGYTVEVARNGELGLLMIEKGTYDLILLDIMMPKMDGIMVLRVIKERMPKSSVIVVSNLDHGPIREEAKKLGAVDYLLKANYTPGQLLEKVKMYLPPAPKNTLPN